MTQFLLKSSTLFLCVKSLALQMVSILKPLLPSLPASLRPLLKDGLLPLQVRINAELRIQLVVHIELPVPLDPAQPVEFVGKWGILPLIAIITCILHSRDVIPLNPSLPWLPLISPTYHRIDILTLAQHTTLPLIWIISLLSS